MYLPSVLRPLSIAGPPLPALDGLAEAPFSVLRGRPGTFAAERLAGLLERWGRLQHCVWLRAGDGRADDVAPALAAACRYRWRPGADPADAADDPGLTLPGGRLEDELRSAPEGAMVVLELSGRCSASAAGRLARQLRPVLTEHRVSVLAVEETRWAWPSAGPALALTGGPPGDPTGGLPGILTGDPAADLAALAPALRRHGLGHRPALLLDLQAAARIWGPELVTASLGTGHGLPAALETLTAELVARLDPAQRTALEVAVGTGYWHPQLGTDPVAAQQLRPWVVPLEQGWGWVRPVWVRPLRRALARVPAQPAAPRTPPRGIAGIVWW